MWMPSALLNEMKQMRQEVINLTQFLFISVNCRKFTPFNIDKHRMTHQTDTATMLSNCWFIAIVDP